MHIIVHIPKRVVSLDKPDRIRVSKSQTHLNTEMVFARRIVCG